MMLLYLAWICAFDNYFRLYFLVSWPPIAAIYQMNFRLFLGIIIQETSKF